MTAMTDTGGEDFDDLDDLLPDDLSSKGSAVPLRRTKSQVVRTVAQEEAEKVKAEKAVREMADKAQAARLAQIVNLHIAGISLAEIGASIGCTADEVDRMLQQDAQRYVRSQPALRIYVRNFVSKHYAEMLAVDMPVATDPLHAEKLEHQDRAIKLLDKMARLHGAEAPVQSEVKVDAAPESIDRMVAALAAQAGRSYDIDVFDEPDDLDEADGERIYDAEVSEVTADDLAEETTKALEASRDVSGNDEGF